MKVNVILPGAVTPIEVEFPALSSYAHFTYENALMEKLIAAGHLRRGTNYALLYRSGFGDGATLQVVEPDALVEATDVWFYNG